MAINIDLQKIRGDALFRKIFIEDDLFGAELAIIIPDIFVGEFSEEAENVRLVFDGVSAITNSTVNDRYPVVADIIQRHIADDERLHCLV